MIDIFGSKNLLKIVTSIYSEEEINNKIISSSLESQFASSIAPSFAKLETFSTADKEIITADFRKSFRKNENKGNILIVDFLGERNAIGNYRDSKLTLNNEVKKFLDVEKINTLMLENRIKLLPGLIENFASVANEYDDVIICEFYLTNQHLDQDNMIKLNPNQYSINKVNALIKTFYDYLKFHNSEYTYVQFDTLYSDTNQSLKPSPWIYSGFSKNYIEKILKEKIK